MDTHRPFHHIIEKQRSHFAEGTTVQYHLIYDRLCALRQSIIKHTNKIIEALHHDLHRSADETLQTEVYLLLQELAFTIHNLKKWRKPQYVSTSLFTFPATGSIVPQPYGIVLIIAPWNYPFLLTLQPLIGALAAGNCAIIKPSEFCPRSSAIIQSIISEVFSDNYVTVINGDVQTSQDLLQEKFDYIFFTGSPRVGKLIMEAAARTLTPLTLELGGKNPVIVHEDADIKSAAQRIMWGKLLNAGQSCIAPDYALVHARQIDAFIQYANEVITELYTTNSKENDKYGRIVTTKHTQRLAQLLDNQNIIYGGDIDITNRYIAPTIVMNPSFDALLMQEEIFGPILPIIPYTTITQALQIINSKPHPLALYLFTKNKDIQQQVIHNTISGGMCINDVLMHITHPKLPFGGVGKSGFGAYHGKNTFDTFTHYKSILHGSPMNFFARMNQQSWKYNIFKRFIYKILF